MYRGPAHCATRRRLARKRVRMLGKCGVRCLQAPWACHLYFKTRTGFSLECTCLLCGLVPEERVCKRTFVYFIFEACLSPGSVLRKVGGGCVSFHTRSVELSPLPARTLDPGYAPRMAVPGSLAVCDMIPDGGRR